MDDRKKRIDEIERAKQESRASLDTLLENFGENLYSRTKDMQVDFEDIILYNVYLKDIAESNSAIGKVEEKNRRFRELEETIEFKEQEEKERSKELEGIHRRLGKTLLENSAYNDFTSLFREQADALSSKLESLESRIKELENKDGGNVFSWIGKSAQGLVLRSFLSKAQESQEQLYLNVGERYSEREASPGEEEDAASIRREIEKVRAVSRTAMDELTMLRDEKRMISAGFGIDGNPQKQIQNLKNHIGQIREELRNLYKNFGAQTCGIMDAEIVPERKYFIDTIVTAEDGEIIGRAVKLNQSISEYDKAIGKLRASLAIDEENSKIEKYRKSIEEKNSRIVEFEKAIADLQESVQESETKIQELQKQL
jgi:chromosome segregation ATPase